MKKFLFTMVLSFLAVVGVSAQSSTNDESKFFVSFDANDIMPLDCGIMHANVAARDGVMMNKPIYTLVAGCGYNITKHISASAHGGYADEFDGLKGFTVGCNGDYHLQLNKKPILNCIDCEANGGVKFEYFNMSKKEDVSTDFVFGPKIERVTYYSYFVTPYVGCTAKLNLDKNKKCQIIASPQINYMCALNDGSLGDFTITCSLGFRYNF